MSALLDNKYVVFKLNEEYYGLSISEVEAIERIMPVTRIPNSPAHVKGVINRRGDVITLLDLKNKLKLPEREIDANSRIIIVNNGELTIGLIVDSSSEVLEIDKDSVDAPPSTIENEYSDYILGIGKTHDRLVILLELSKILEL